MRVALVIAAENIKKSDKLLMVKVKTVGGERQVIAGIAKYYKPEDLVGKKVLVVANLKPAKLMGRESQGMILAVDDSEVGDRIWPPSSVVPSQSGPLGNGRSGRASTCSVEG